MTMRVAIDATAIPAKRLGAGVYVTELLRHVDPSDADLHVFVKEDDALDLHALIPHATMHPVRVSSRPARIAWSHSLLPGRVERLRPDVFHGPHYTLPSRLRCSSVVTFHDPTFFTLPHLHERKKVAYFTRAARTGIARARRVVAVSAYARRGAIEHAGADPKRVDVVYEGVDHARYRPTGAAAHTGKPDSSYILFVGALEPRKNIPALISAYDRLDVSHDLVIVGPRAWGASAVEEAIARSPRKGTIRVTGFVSDEEKIRLFQHADVFVYPAIAEGFGVPVLEAMACGTPVITTTGSAPEEVADGAAVLVAPNDVDGLGEAIRQVVTNREHADELRRRGLKRGLGFSWQTAARATVDVWRRAAET